MNSARTATIGVLVWLVLASTSANNVAAQPATAQPAASALPQVTLVEGNLEADDLIKVEIDHLADWAAANNPAKLVPYLNGLPIRGCYPEEIHTSKTTCNFIFRLRRITRKPGSICLESRRASGAGYSQCGT